MKKHLFKAVLTVLLCTMLTVTASAIGITVDNTLAGLLAGETYTANSYDILTGETGNENIAVDKTTVFDAGLWEITTPDGTEYVFVPGDTTGQINFWDSTTNAPADVVSTKSELDPGKWTASNDLLLMSEIDHANFDAGSNDGFAFKGRRTAFADELNAYYFQYTFTNEQIVPAKLFESWSVRLVPGNTFNLIDGKTVKTTVTFYLKSIGDTKLTPVVVDATYTDGVFTVTAPAEFAESDAYIVAMDIAPWGGNAADETLYEGLASSNNFFGMALNKGTNAVVVDTTKYEYATPDVELVDIAFAQEEIDMTVNGTATLELIFTPDDAIDKSVIFSSDNTSVMVTSDGTVTAPSTECTAVITATSRANPSLSASITVNVIAPSVPTGITGENGHLEGLEPGLSYQAAPLTINADGTGLTKGAYIDVDSTTELAGLYVVRQGNDNTHSADSEIVYVPGDADKRNYLGQLGTNGMVAVRAMDKAFYPGFWTEKAIATHSSFGTWMLGNTGNGQLTAAQLKAWITANTNGDDVAKEVAAKVIVDTQNSISYRYGFEAEEIVPVEEVLSHFIRVQQNNFYVVYKTLRTKIVAYVADENGNVTAYSKVCDNDLFVSMYTTIFSFNIDYTSFLPEEGYLVGLEIFPATDIAYDEFVKVASNYAGPQRFLVDVNPANYKIMTPVVAPEFSYAPAKQGIEVTITNYDKDATYTVGTTTLQSNKFILTKLGKYLVTVSGDHLIGTATAYATPTLFTPVAPILSYEANSPDTYLIKIENYSDIYSYEILDYDGWKTLDGDTVEVSVPYTYAVRASGVAFDGYAEAEIDVESCVASDPTVKVVAVKDGCMVYITNHSPLYNYEYKLADSSIWTPVKGSSFKVTKNGTYVLRAYGSVYSNEATVRFVTKELPDALKNLSVRKVNVDGFEEYWLDGLDPDVVYGYAKVDIRTDFNTLYYYDVIGDTESYLLDGIGLYAIRIASAVDGYDGTPYIIYADSSSEDKVQLGEVIDKGGYQALKTHNTTDWIPGTWTGNGSATHQVYSNPYFLSSTGNNYIAGSYGSNLMNAVDRGDEAAIATAKAAIIEKANAVNYKYAYAPEEIVHVSDFLAFTFTTSRRQGSINLGEVYARVVFYVMDPSGGITAYEWLNAHQMISQTKHTININYLDADGNPASDIDGFPSDGWVVGVEIYPWYNANAKNITSTGNVFNAAALTVQAPVTVKSAPKVALTTFDALPGDLGGVLGFAQDRPYSYRLAGSQSEWTYVPQGTKLLRLPAGTFEFKSLEVPYKYYDSEIVLVTIYESEDAMPTDFTDYGITETFSWFYYESTGTLRFMGTVMPNYSNYNTPWYNYRTNIKEVIISDGLTNLSNYAFYYFTNITSIYIPESVTNIGNGAFLSCSKLESITIPAGVTYIGNQALSFCTNLKEIKVAEGNQSFTIFDNALYNKAMTQLILLPAKAPNEEYNIPYGVEAIGANAFYSCQNIKKITIPASVRSISLMQVFTNALSLEEIAVAEDNIYYRNFGSGLYNYALTQLIAFPAMAPDTEHSIPNGVKTIPTSAFNNCINLQSITIPEGVTKIEANTFYGCTSLQSIIIPEGVTTIRSGAFSGCKALEYVNIPEGVTKIETNTFYGCTSLQSITIPEGVTTIGNQAFYNCKSLKSIFIPKNVTSIGAYVFIDNQLDFIEVDTANSYYTSIDGVLFNSDETILLQYPGGRKGEYIVPDGTKKLDAYSMWSNINLTRIVLPASLEEIGNSAISGLKTLSEIVVDDESEYFVSVDGVLFNKDMTVLVQVPAGIKLDRYDIPDGVTELGVASLQGINHISTVTLPEGITKIGNLTFNAFNAKYLNIPSSVEEIGTTAFSYANILELYNDSNIQLDQEKNLYGEGNVYKLIDKNGNVTYRKGVEEDENGFIYMIKDDSCRLVGYIGALHEVTLPLTYNGMICGYSNIRGIENVIIPEGVTEIPANAISAHAETVTVPASVTAIEKGAFPEGVLLKVYKDSYAQSFAEEYGFDYELLNTTQAVFTLSNAKAMPGETVKLTLSLKSSAKINSIALTNLTYNSDILEFIGFGDYEYIEDMAMFPPVFDYERGYILIALNDDIAFDGDICTLEFKVKEYAPDCYTEIWLNPLVKCDSDSIGSVLESGEVTVHTYLTGDIDLDGDVDIDDAIHLFGNTMIPEYYPTEYPGDMDFDGDGNIDLQDAVAVFRYSMLPDVYPLTIK